MNWLITGGCGFIGTSLANKLLSDKSKKHNIRILDNLSTTYGSKYLQMYNNVFRK